MARDSHALGFWAWQIWVQAHPSAPPNGSLLWGTWGEEGGRWGISALVVGGPNAKLSSLDPRGPPSPLFPEGWSTSVFNAAIVIASLPRIVEESEEWLGSQGPPHLEFQRL